MKVMVKKIRDLCSIHLAKLAYLEANLRTMISTRQRVNNPYKDAVIRTESSGLKPILLNNAAGSKNDLPDMYKPAPKPGNSVAGLPNAVQYAALAYVPSSGPRALGVFGNAKNATTLTINEAKTIAYNLLFKVVNFTLKSFIISLTVNRSLIYGSSKTSVKPLGHADPGSESHTSHCHMGALQAMTV